MTDLLAAVLEACERAPERPAITLGGVTVTFGELRSRIDRVADGLGIAPGDRVLFSVRPGIDAVVLALGIITAGGTVVFADPGAGEALFGARAALAAPKWVAAESVLYAASTPLVRPLARRRGIELPDYHDIVPGARHVYAGRWLPGVPRGAVSLRRLTRRRRRASALSTARQVLGARSAPNSSALIIFTSGTTDHPKAVVHSRASLGAGLGDFADSVGFVPGERVLTDQLMVGIPALIAGAHWVMPPPGGDPGARPERFLDLLPEADVLFAVPAALDALLGLLDEHPDRTPDFRALIVGGAPVLRPLLERVRARLPRTTIRAVYGMTEMLPVSIADGDEKLAFDGAGDFVGTLAPHVEALIHDGELVVRGPGLALGYLGEPPLRELRTGDLARLEPRDGGTASEAGSKRIVLTGRTKDMFIRGTTNIYPGLYEPIIAGLPTVAQAALVGIPNRIGDDVIVLAVVLERGAGPDALELIRRRLPGLMDAAALPDRVVAVPALPVAGRSSKLDRAALAAMVAELVGPDGRGAGNPR
jgi:acyl-CoA synthetase (AMP-forming)/AMP-acid ligase II